MCRVRERYRDGTEEVWDGKKIGENGTVILLIPNRGVIEIPKARIVEMELETDTAPFTPLLT